jgi:hypothetical protein
MDVEIKDFNHLLSLYDTKLMVANKDTLILTAINKELKDENKNLRDELQAVMKELTASKEG